MINTLTNKGFPLGFMEVAHGAELPPQIVPIKAQYRRLGRSKTKACDAEWRDLGGGEGNPKGRGHSSAIAALSLAYVTGLPRTRGTLSCERTCGKMAADAAGEKP